MSLKFSDLQLLDMPRFFGGVTSLDSFVKAYWTSQTKRFFPSEWFDVPSKIENTELPTNDSSYSKHRSCNVLEAKKTNYVSLVENGLITEQALMKFKLSEPLPSGTKIYQYLQNLWKQKQMFSLKDMFCWSIGKDVVPTL